MCSKERIYFLIAEGESLLLLLSSVVLRTKLETLLLNKR